MVCARAAVPIRIEPFPEEEVPTSRVIFPAVPADAFPVLITTKPVAVVPVPVEILCVPETPDEAFPLIKVRPPVPPATALVLMVSAVFAVVAPEVIVRVEPVPVVWKTEVAAPVRLSAPAEVRASVPEEAVERVRPPVVFVQEEVPPDAMVNPLDVFPMVTLLAVASVPILMFPVLLSPKVSVCALVVEIVPAVSKVREPDWEALPVLLMVNLVVAPALAVKRSPRPLSII